MTMVAPTDGKRAYYWQSQRNRSTLPPPNQPSCARSCKCLWRTEDKSEWPSWHAHDAMNRGVICGRYSNSLSESSCEQEHHISLADGSKSAHPTAVSIIIVGASPVAATAVTVVVVVFGDGNMANSAHTSPLTSPRPFVHRRAYSVSLRTWALVQHPSQRHIVSQTRRSALREIKGPAGRRCALLGRRGGPPSSVPRQCKTLRRLGRRNMTSIDR